MSLGDNLGPARRHQPARTRPEQPARRPGTGVREVGRQRRRRRHPRPGATWVPAQPSTSVSTSAAGTTPPSKSISGTKGADTFRVSVIDPAGNATGVVNVGAVGNFTLAGRQLVRDRPPEQRSVQRRQAHLHHVQSRHGGDDSRGQLAHPARERASPSGGRFDAWIQRGTMIARFLAPHVNNNMTISTPGTAAEVITAASYITRGAGVGSLSSFSSRGPTRDGRRGANHRRTGAGDLLGVRAQHRGSRTSR